MRKLIVNADDFGFTRDVNQGIIEAHTRGILTATTIMANGQEFDDAVRLAHQHPTLDIGCHLVLVGGESMYRRGRALPGSVPELMAAVTTERLDAYQELKPQVEKIMAAGLAPSHLDTHKHTHLFPPVLDAVARLSQEYGVRWIRRPFDFPLVGANGIPWAVRALSRSFGLVKSGFYGTLARYGCRATDNFAGFQLTGRFRVVELVGLLTALPEGSTEFMCHPGRCTDELRRARTRLKESREQELDALIAAEVRDALDALGIELTNYRDLGS